MFTSCHCYKRLTTNVLSPKVKVSAGLCPVCKFGGRASDKWRPAVFSSYCITLASASLTTFPFLHWPPWGHLWLYQVYLDNNPDQYPYLKFSTSLCCQGWYCHANSHSQRQKYLEQGRAWRLEALLSLPQAIKMWKTGLSLLTRASSGEQTHGQWGAT